MRVVEFVLQNLQVDGQWCQLGERGFSWWPESFAERVWAEPPYEDDGITLSRIHIRTDLLRQVPDGAASPGLIALMLAADLSGMIWFDGDGSSSRCRTSDARTSNQEDERVARHNFSGRSFTVY